MIEKELETLLKALANRRRLAIITLHKKTNINDVGVIANHLKISFRATSKHLRILASVDIVNREQRGVQAFYCINKDDPLVVKQIITFL